MKKLVKELKWLLVSALIVASVFGLVIGIAVFSQWRVDVNTVRLEAGQIDQVSYTNWK